MSDAAAGTVLAICVLALGALVYFILGMNDHQLLITLTIGLYVLILVAIAQVRT